MPDYPELRTDVPVWEWVSAAEGVKFSQTMNEFIEVVRSLGKCQIGGFTMQEKLVSRAKRVSV